MQPACPLHSAATVGRRERRLTPRWVGFDTKVIAHPHVARFFPVNARARVLLDDRVEVRDMTNFAFEPSRKCRSTDVHRRHAGRRHTTGAFPAVRPVVPTQAYTAPAAPLEDELLAPKSTSRVWVALAGLVSLGLGGAWLFWPSSVEASVSEQQPAPPVALEAAHATAAVAPALVTPDVEPPELLDVDAEPAAELVPGPIAMTSARPGPLADPGWWPTEAPSASPQPTGCPDVAPRVVRAPVMELSLVRTRAAGRLVDNGYQQLDLGRYQRAAELFRVAVKRSPTDSEAWFGLALARAELGQVKLARAAAEHTLDLAPQHGSAVVLLGFLAQQKKDVASSRELYAKYLEQHPDGAQAEELRKVLEQLPQ